MVITFLGYIVKILFLDSHAKILQVVANLDIFIESTMSVSWQDLPCFSKFFCQGVSNLDSLGTLAYKLFANYFV